MTHSIDDNYLQLVFIQILPCTTVKGIVISPILLMTISCHSPYGILKCHRRSHMWSRIEGFEITAWMHDRDEMILFMEESLVPIAVSTTFH